MEQFIDILEMIEFSKIPGKTFESYKIFLPNLGRMLIKDLEKKFDLIYDLVEEKVGDVRIDLTDYRAGMEEDLPLGGYIKQKESAGQKVKVVSGAKVQGN